MQADVFGAGRIAVLSRPDNRSRNRPSAVRDKIVRRSIFRISGSRFRMRGSACVRDKRLWGSSHQAGRVTSQRQSVRHQPFKPHGPTPFHFRRLHLLRPQNKVGFAMDVGAAIRFFEFPVRDFERLVRDSECYFRVASELQTCRSQSAIVEVELSVRDFDQIEAKNSRSRLIVRQFGIKFGIVRFDVTITMPPAGVIPYI